MLGQSVTRRIRRTVHRHIYVRLILIPFTSSMFPLNGTICRHVLRRWLGPCIESTYICALHRRPTIICHTHTQLYYPEYHLVVAGQCAFFVYGWLMLYVEEIRRGAAANCIQPTTSLLCVHLISGHNRRRDSSYVFDSI